MYMSNAYEPRIEMIIIICCRVTSMGLRNESVGPNGYACMANGAWHRL